MLKQVVLLGMLFLCVSYVTAQEPVNVKLDIETGLILTSTGSEGLGLFINAEPKIRFSDNSFIGMKIGLTFNAHTFREVDRNQYSIDDVQNNALLSFVPTYEYYLNDDYYRPYVGLGVGYHLVANYIDVYRSTNASEGVLQGNVKKRLGFLLRGGFDTGWIRFGLEYNFIPKTNIVIPNEIMVGTVTSSYAGLSVGWTLIGRERLE